MRTYYNLYVYNTHVRILFLQNNMKLNVSVTFYINFSLVKKKQRDCTVLKNEIALVVSKL